MTFSENHHNNFDSLRILAAAMVLFSHQFALLGQPEPAILPATSLGGTGVCIFFSISGYLVAKSWLRDPDIFRFILRRFLRIWPALFVATCGAALVIGPLVSTLTIDEYIHSEQTLRFFRTLYLKIEYALPGVFATNPFPNAVNGSLWTIPLEVKWYAVLLIAGVLRVLRYKWIVLAILFLLAIYHFGIDHAEPNFLREFGLYFIYGVCMHLFHNAWNDKKIVGAVVIGTLAFVIGFTGYPMIALLLALPCLVIVFGTTSTPVIRRFGRFGDISYGMYIYAFPVQQFIIWLSEVSEDRFSFLTYLSLSFATTVLLAFASWHLIEKPVIQMKPGARSVKFNSPRQEASTQMGS